MNPPEAGVVAPTEPTTATQSLRSFQVFKTTFETLNQGFQTDVQGDQTVARRLRRLEVDVEQLRQEGKLEAYETYIPVRMIDTNISQKMPQKLAYLKSSNRLAIFEPEVVVPNAPPPDTARVESEFWRVLTYTDWEIPFIRVTDGAEFVGYDWVKVLYTPQPDRPGNVTIDHVGRENLLFDLSVKDIQDSKLIAERYPMTMVSLTRIAREFKFKAEDVIQIREKISIFNKNADSSGDSIAYNDYNEGTCIYRIFFKEAGIVWTSWYAPCIDHYLTEPKLFYNGVDFQQEVPAPPVPGQLEMVMQKVWTPVEETAYPYYPVVRKITEDARISQSVGAVESDYPLQEAASSIFSSQVNQGFLASQVMWSPDGDAFDKTGAPKQLSLKFERGQIWDRAMRAFTAPAPDPSISRIVQDLQQLNGLQNNSIAWTVQNRQDSRKTATEVSESARMQSQVNSSETFMLAIAIRAIMTGAWRIVQSQAMRNLIVFCPLAEGGNDLALVGLQFKLKAAGDTDYVEKQQTIANMQQDWPIVQQTPAAMPFLSDYLRLRYPNRANVYIGAIAQGEQQNAQLIQQLKAVLKEAVTDENGMLTPEFAPYGAQIQSLIADSPASGGEAPVNTPEQTPAAT